MKRKTKLFLSLVSLCFSVAVLCFGVYSAISVSYTISGSVHYEVTDAFVEIETKVYALDIGQTMTEEEMSSLSNQMSLPTLSFDEFDSLIEDQLDISDFAPTQEFEKYNSLTNTGTPNVSGINVDYNNAYIYIIIINVKNLSDENFLSISVENNIQNIELNSEVFISSSIANLTSSTNEGKGQNMIVGFSLADPTMSINHEEFDFTLNVQSTSQEEASSPLLKVMNEVSAVQTISPEDISLTIENQEVSGNNTLTFETSIQNISEYNASVIVMQLESLQSLQDTYVYFNIKSSISFIGVARLDSLILDDNIELLYSRSDGCNETTVSVPVSELTIYLVLLHSVTTGDNTIQIKMEKVEQTFQSSHTLGDFTSINLVPTYSVLCENQFSMIIYNMEIEIPENLSSDIGGYLNVNVSLPYLMTYEINQPIDYYGVLIGHKTPADIRALSPNVLFPPSNLVLAYWLADGYRAQTIDISSIIPYISNGKLEFCFYLLYANRSWNLDGSAIISDYSSIEFNFSIQSSSFSFIYFKNDDDTYSVAGSSLAEDGIITIPSTYNGKQVTKIVGWAFCCDTPEVAIHLSRVYIPSSIKEIGYNAFANVIIDEVYFEVTDGWYITNSVHSTSGTTIDSNELSSPESAANTLTTNTSRYWKR